jgi:serine/threonine protein kinase/TolB-like protein/Tfp pilus assembly protein PilF
MGLTAAQMGRMSRLLDEALDLDESGRRAWLGRLPPEDRDLVKALSQALFPSPTRRSGDKQQWTLPELGADPNENSEASGLAAGARFGAYELIRPLGAGGMAEVWLARRADGAFKREVALKLPQLSNLRYDLAQRFMRERDILASLEHPNIARLYDAGNDPQGLPYLSMEFVQGQAITTWCDAHCLPIRARLELFLQVLKAVQYAHDRQVLHRDLKASNILVTEGGEVRLLDFGVAKLLEEPDSTQPELTGMYGRALTPGCASPELLRGDPIDARSDVYSLGVLLYEFLCGSPPYRLKAAASLGMAVQAVGSVEVRPPSAQLEQNAIAARATSADKLARDLHGDLDAIVIKALSKSPEQRYGSAEAMAADLQRYLRGEPVLARTDGVAYRARKFIRRHRVAVGVTATTLGTIAVAIAAIWLNIRDNYRLTTVGGGAGSGSPGSSMSVPATFTPPPHSVAVLPFANLSGDPQQEYFSDGMSEELINALVHVEALQVIARTSSFSFKGQNLDIGSIGRKLNVAAILEGSVRRSGNTVRITAQLINAVSGLHMWSQEYDRDLKDALALQTDIATAVAEQLQAKLFGDEAAKVEVGGTVNPVAYDAYLRGKQLSPQAENEGAYRNVIAAYDQAIAADPNYAAAYASRAVELMDITVVTHDANSRDALRKQSRQDAEKAVALAPEMADGHAALSFVLANASFDFAGAAEEAKRALVLEPGSAKVQSRYALVETWLGHHDSAIAAERKAILLDPRSYRLRVNLMYFYYDARRFDEALALADEARAVNPKGSQVSFLTWSIDLAMGKPEQAQQYCEQSTTPLDEDDRHACLALAYRALGKKPQALSELEKYKKLDGDSAAYEYAEIAAQWGESATALRWLATAERLRDSGLTLLRVDWMLDPIRNEPEFKALEQRLNMPP